MNKKYYLAIFYINLLKYLCSYFLTWIYCRLLLIITFLNAPKYNFPIYRKQNLSKTPVLHSTIYCLPLNTKNNLSQFHFIWTSFKPRKLTFTPMKISNGNGVTIWPKKYTISHSIFLLFFIHTCYIIPGTWYINV